MNFLVDNNRQPKFVPFMLLSISFWSVGGLAAALMMMPDFDNGGVFKPFEETGLLKNLADALGRPAALVIVYMIVSAGAGAVVGWRIYRALKALNNRQKSQIK